MRSARMTEAYDSHTCKHGDLVNVVEFTEVFAIETSPKIGN